MPSIWNKIGKGLGYIFNPAGLIVDIINDTTNNTPEADAYRMSHEGSLDGYKNAFDSLGDKWNQFKNWLGQRWNDLTGKSQMEMQNQFNRELAEEEYQRNLDAIGDTAAAYEAAGFNRNLMYNQSPAQFNAPQLTAYSGSQKIDKILQRTGQVLSMIPAMYQATAALEGIDQARERTKQSEIKTMSMGMSLLDQGYKLGNTQILNPFAPNLERDWFSSKRHFRDMTELDSRLPIYKFGVEYQRYADAAIKNKFDLLNSIGIKNQMNSTLNNWRGYQYELDRRFGTAGRIVGLGAQGFNAAAKFFSPIKFGK